MDLAEVMERLITSASFFCAIQCTSHGVSTHEMPGRGHAFSTEKYHGLRANPFEHRQNRKLDLQIVNWIHAEMG